jgi:integrase
MNKKKSMFRNKRSANITSDLDITPRNKAMKVELKYLHSFKDRHGRERIYFRRPNQKQISLPDSDSPEFMDAYRAALSGDAMKPKLTADRVESGTFREAVLAYYQSTGFLMGGPKTRAWKRYELEGFCSTRLNARPDSPTYGELPVRGLQYEHVDALVAKKVNKPGACLSFVHVLRMLMKYCIKTRRLDRDPTLGIDLPRLSAHGFRNWTEDEIARFEARHPIGTKERLALAIPLYTALRREDVVRLGWEHVEDGIIHICPRKTEKTTGVILHIPIHPELAKLLEMIPRSQPTFLRTTWRRQFTPPNLTVWFAKVCKAAGLPKGWSIHGLRKACCRRLAESGCTVHEIMSVSGHTTLKEVERYTKAAMLAPSAKTAMGNVVRFFPATAKPQIGKPVTEGLPLDLLPIENTHILDTSRLR